MVGLQSVLKTMPSSNSSKQKTMEKTEITDKTENQPKSVNFYDFQGN